MVSQLIDYENSFWILALWDDEEFDTDISKHEPRYLDVPSSWIIRSRKDRRAHELSLPAQSALELWDPIIA